MTTIDWKHKLSSRKLWAAAKLPKISVKGRLLFFGGVNRVMDNLHEKCLELPTESPDE